MAYTQEGERKVVKVEISEEVSQWHTIKAKCEAERFPGLPLLDTGIELQIPRFTITWDDKDKLMQELAELLRKYQI